MGYGRRGKKGGRGTGVGISREITVFLLFLLYFDMFMGK